MVYLTIEKSNVSERFCKSMTGETDPERVLLQASIVSLFDYTVPFA